MNNMNRQLLGEEQDEQEQGQEQGGKNISSNDASEEREGEQGGQIIAFESKVLDYINKQHYHGLVR